MSLIIGQPKAKPRPLILPGSSDFRVEVNTPQPVRKDYLVKNDAIMVPDRGFTKQLKTLRSSLEVVWDWGSSKWKIWDFPADAPPYHVMTVETKNKTYREVGADVLIHLQKQMSLDYKEILAFLEESDNQMKRQKAKAFKDKIKSIAFDTFNYTRNVLQVQVPQHFKIEGAVRDA